jgi:putative ABC transport system substrate-binding protein
VTFLNDDLAGKRLELLKETLPSVSRVALMWEPIHVDNEVKGIQAVAPSMGVRTHVVEIPRPPRPDEIDRGMQAVRGSNAEALVVAPSGFTIFHRARIIEMAIKNRLPVVSAWRIFAEDGALLTYGPEIFQVSRRVAYFVDKILKGAKPADLPVEQPSKFEFFVNLKSAKQIGLTIPPNVLARADKVIR